MPRPPKRSAKPPVRVMVEIAVEQNAAPAAILRMATGSNLVGLEIDQEYQPVPMRPQREHAERLAAANQTVVLVRGHVAADAIERLESQPGVLKVWLDEVVEPFAAAKRAGRGKKTRRARARPRARSRPAKTTSKRTPKPRTSKGSRARRKSPREFMPEPEPSLPPRHPRPPRRRRPRPRSRKYKPPWIHLQTPPVRPPAVDCATSGAPMGTLAQVATDLGVDQIWAAGQHGENIVIGIVDCGITAIGRTPRPGESANVPGVIGGFPAADWGTTSAAWDGHGNMCATDVLGMAPNAQLWDIRIAEVDDTSHPAANFAAYVSNAIAGYEAAIQNYLNFGTPQILSNSWGLYNSQNGPAFATDPTHPFTRKVEEALDAGIFVLFAAGNCGAVCPSSRCGGSIGSGASILGPNGHARVMTVGAANRNDGWCGFSSQGPAALPPYAAKPDFCATSHFSGYFPRGGSVVPFDGGTSAATAVAAGVVALLKQKQPALTQDQAKAALMNTAKDIRAPGWDIDSGAGIIRAKAAYNTI